MNRMDLIASFRNFFGVRVFFSKHVTHSFKEVDNGSREFG